MDFNVSFNLQESGHINVMKENSLKMETNLNASETTNILFYWFASLFVVK